MPAELRRVVGGNGDVGVARRDVFRLVGVGADLKVGPYRVGLYSFRYSRSLLVWALLTGISVPFASFIRRM